MDASSLTPRQQEVYHCLLQGDINRRISRKLDISEATVKTHVQAILQTFGMKSRVQLLYKHQRAIIMQQAIPKLLVIVNRDYNDQVVRNRLQLSDTSAVSVIYASQGNLPISTMDRGNTFSNVILVDMTEEEFASSFPEEYQVVKHCMVTSNAQFIPVAI